MARPFTGMQLLWGGLRCIPQSALQGYGSRSPVRILILNKGLPLQPGIAMQRTKREHKTPSGDATLDPRMRPLLRPPCVERD